MKPSFISIFLLLSAPFLLALAPPPHSQDFIIEISSSSSESDESNETDPATSEQENLLDVRSLAGEDHSTDSQVDAEVDQSFSESLSQDPQSFIINALEEINRTADPTQLSPFQLRLQRMSELAESFNTGEDTQMEMSQNSNQKMHNLVQELLDSELFEWNPDNPRKLMFLCILENGVIKEFKDLKSFDDADKDKHLLVLPAIRIKAGNNLKEPHTLFGISYEEFNERPQERLALILYLLRRQHSDMKSGILPSKIFDYVLGSYDWRLLINSHRSGIQQSLSKVLKKQISKDRVFMIKTDGQSFYPLDTLKDVSWDVWKQLWKAIQTALSNFDKKIQDNEKRKSLKRKNIPRKLKDWEGYTHKSSDSDEGPSSPDPKRVRKHQGVHFSGENTVISSQSQSTTIAGEMLNKTVPYERGDQTAEQLIQVLENPQSSLDNKKQALKHMSYDFRRYLKYDLKDRKMNNWFTHKASEQELSLEQAINDLIEQTDNQQSSSKHLYLNA